MAKGGGGKAGGGGRGGGGAPTLGEYEAAGGRANMLLSNAVNDGVFATGPESDFGQLRASQAQMEVAMAIGEGRVATPAQARAVARQAIKNWRPGGAKEAQYQRLLNRVRRDMGG